MNIPIENEQGEVVDVVTSAQQAASIVEGRGQSVYVGMTKVISVRLPVLLLAQLQGLAHKSGKTRNAMVATLLEVGIDEVKAELLPETLEELADITSEYFADVVDGIEKC